MSTIPDWAIPHIMKGQTVYLSNPGSYTQELAQWFKDNGWKIVQWAWSTHPCRDRVEWHFVAEKN